MQTIVAILCIAAGCCIAVVWAWGQFAPKGVSGQLDTAAAWMSAAILQAEHAASVASAKGVWGTLIGLKAWQVFDSVEAQSALQMLIGVVETRLARLEESGK